MCKPNLTPEFWTGFVAATADRSTPITRTRCSRRLPDRRKAIPEASAGSRKRSYLRERIAMFHPGNDTVSIEPMAYERRKEP